MCDNYSCPAATEMFCALVNNYMSSLWSMTVWNSSASPPSNKMEQKQIRYFLITPYTPSKKNKAVNTYWKNVKEYK